MKQLASAEYRGNSVNRIRMCVSSWVHLY